MSGVISGVDSCIPDRPPLASLKVVTLILNSKPQTQTPKLAEWMFPRKFCSMP
jgi:hypothetical protein